MKNVILCLRRFFCRHAFALLRKDGQRHPALHHCGTRRALGTVHRTRGESYAQRTGQARFTRAGKEAMTTETTQVGAGESSPAPDGSHPPLEHVAWVLKHVADHLKEGGTFRYLIYDRMGYGPEAYLPLYEAGGMAISNAFCELKELRSANDKAHGRETAKENE